MNSSVRSPGRPGRFRAVAVLAAASCVAAALVTAGGAATAGAVRPTAPHAPRAAARAADGRIAFSQWDLLPGSDLSHHSNVYTIRPDGTGLRQLTKVGKAKAAASPSWSPGGARIAYESNQSGDYRIWVMKSDGSGKRRLTNDPDFADLQPDWSPDGTHILFSRCDDHLGFIAQCDLDVISAAGTGMRRLAGGHWTYVHGEYSPDGQRIVVSVDRGGFLSALWVMRSDGTDLHRITRPSLEAFWPAWSPNGRRIVFSDNCCQFGSNVWTVRPDGTGLTKLTHLHPPVEADFASYSPSGRQIVLHSSGKCPARGICAYFYIMNADGSGLHAVHTGVANTFLTDWGRPR